MLFLRYYLWLAPQVLLAVLLVLLLRRRLQKQLPLFAAYIAIDEIANLGEDIVAFHHPFLPDVYAWTFLFGDGLSSILKLAVIYVLADHLIFARFRFLPKLRVAFGAILALMILVAAIAGGTLSNVSVRVALNIFHTFDFALGLIQVGMLLTLFIFSRALRVPWRKWMTGVVLGFGVSACFELSGATLRNYFGNPSLVVVDIIESVGFHVGVVIWIIYALLPEKSGPSGRGLEKRELESWNERLEGLV